MSRLSVLSFLLFAACADEAPVSPVKSADATSADLAQDDRTPRPPPGSLTLTTTPWVGGQAVTVTVSGAATGDQVRLLLSTDVQGPGACPAILAPDCLDVANPFKIMSTRTADATGVATFVLVPPDPVPSGQARIQGVVLAAGGGADTSNAPAIALHDTGSDLDGDGLTALDELLIGTDPGAADTDGGGADDGTEITVGTDPTDASDDVIPPTWDADVYPMLSTNCAGCHTGFGASGGFNLDDYNDVVAAPSIDVPGMNRVEPFDTANSYLWHKIEGTQTSVGGSGSTMPQGGVLSAADRTLLEDWIDTGALEQ